MQLLNTIDTQYFYDNFQIIASKDASTKEKFYQFNLSFLALINTLTEKREKQVFTGFFAKINFLAQAYDLGQDKEEELQALRRLLKRNLVNAKFKPSQQQLLSALKLMAELVRDFSAIEIPNNILNFYQNKELPLLSYKAKPSDTLNQLFATILEKGDITLDKQNKGHILILCDTEDYGKIQIDISDIHYHNPKGERFRNYKLSQHVAALVKPYQEICLTNLEKIEESFFASTDQTLLTASPDYLIDASAIANCWVSGALSPYLYFFNKLKFFQGNEHTLAGQLINNILDDYLEQGEEDYEKAFRKSFVESQVDVALLNLNRPTLKEIHARLKPQFENLKKVTSDFKAEVLTTEPSFISSTFGLQGRIDILVEQTQNTERKDIIELKSTAYTDPKSYIARQDHLLQVACYNLLIDSTFPKRNGVSAVLYARDNMTPLRDCGKLNFQTQDVLWLRNCIVYIDLELAQNPHKIFGVLFQKLHQAQLPKYRQEEVNQFIQKWSKASKLEQNYVIELTGLVTRELLTAKVGGVAGQEPSQGYASLWRNTLEQKLGSFALLKDLKIDKIDSEQSNITFLRQANEVTAFRDGDIIVLYPMDKADCLEPNRHQLLKGSIVKIRQHSIEVKIWHKKVDKAFFEKYPLWAIEPNFMEKSYTHQYASLSEFLSFDKVKKGLFLGLKAPEFDKNLKVEYRPFLSDEQNNILNKALSAKNYFLLQGPPGTGKTSKMLRSMVDYLYKNTSETVVLLAFTNRATDEISQKVNQVCGDDFVRLGTLTENSNFSEYYLQKQKDYKAIRAKLQNTRVFVSTVSSFYNHLNIIPSYDTVIIDEASQLLEPSLCGILPRFKRFILIGDEKQLPAVVTQPLEYCKTENPLLQNIGLGDMSISVFERLLENAQNKMWHNSFAMLSTQFRTHEDIADFISKEFYKTLKIGADYQKTRLNLYNPNSEDKHEQFLASSRLLFIPSQKEDNFKFHKEEAKKVIELLKSIQTIFTQKGEFDEETVGVITPYRAQIAEIYKGLDDDLREKVTVDTVERYQGSERRIIIISMAVNHLAQMQNLQAFNTKMTVDKKLNVALSRAKEQLILLGNPRILEAGKFYQKFLERF